MLWDMMAVNGNDGEIGMGTGIGMEMEMGMASEMGMIPTLKQCS